MHYDESARRKQRTLEREEQKRRMIVCKVHSDVALYSEETPGTFSIFLFSSIIFFSVSLTSRSPRHRLPFEHGGAVPIPLTLAVYTQYIFPSLFRFLSICHGGGGEVDRDVDDRAVVVPGERDLPACLFAVWRTAMSVSAPLLA